MSEFLWYPHKTAARRFKNCTKSSRNSLEYRQKRLHETVSEFFASVLPGQIGQSHPCKALKSSNPLQKNCAFRLTLAQDRGGTKGTNAPCAPRQQKKIPVLPGRGSKKQLIFGKLSHIRRACAANRGITRETREMRGGRAAKAGIRGSGALGEDPGIPEQARQPPYDHFHSVISGRSTPYSAIYCRCSTSLSFICWIR